MYIPLAISCPNHLLTQFFQQLRWWLVHQYVKEHTTDTSLLDPENPMTILMSKLTSCSTLKPRHPIPCNLWAKAHSGPVDQQFAKKLQGLGKTHRSQLMNIRNVVVQDLYGKLDQGTRDHWICVANTLHKERLKEWQSSMSKPASTDPEDLQR